MSWNVLFRLRARSVSGLLWEDPVPGGRRVGPHEMTGPTREAIRYLLRLKSLVDLAEMERDAKIAEFVAGNVAMILLRFLQHPDFLELGIPFSVSPYPMTDPYRSSRLFLRSSIQGLRHSAEDAQPGARPPPHSVSLRNRGSAALHGGNGEAAGPTSGRGRSSRRGIPIIPSSGTARIGQPIPPEPGIRRFQETPCGNVSGSPSRGS
jgi:hypothetical protein